MKNKLFVIVSLIAVSLAACSAPQTSPTQNTPANPPVDSTPARTATPTTPAPTAASQTDEETEVRNVVESFGKRIQNVSLLSPTAAQEMKQQYLGFVAPALLGTWMKDVSKAPGRKVSSPWPDRIEIASLAKDGSDRYLVTGSAIEISSVEVVNGGEAVRIPVRIVVERANGRWLITDYAEGQ